MSCNLREVFQFRHTTVSCLTGMCSDVIGRFDSEEYRQWADVAARNDLGNIAGDEYYRDERDGLFEAYTVDVGGKVVRCPLYTRDEWFRYDGNLSEMVEVDQETDVDPVHDEAALQEWAAKMAYRTGQNVADTKITDHVWNGDLFTPTRVSLDGPKLTVAQSDYFSYLSNSSQLLTELYLALFDAGVDPTAGRAEVRQVIDDLSLPYREEVVPSMSKVTGEIGDHHPAIGVSAIPIIRTEDGHKMMLLKRGERVASSPGQYAGVGGVMDHSTDPQHHLLRETVEELFGAEEGTHPMEHPNGKRLLNALDAKDAHIDYLMTCVDASRASYHIRMLLYVENEQLGEWVLKEHNPNFETKTMKLVDIEDPQVVGRLPTEYDFSPTTGGNVYEALRHLHEQYDVGVGEQITRVVP